MLNLCHLNDNGELKWKSPWESTLPQLRSERIFQKGFQIIGSPLKKNRIFPVMADFQPAPVNVSVLITWFLELTRLGQRLFGKTLLITLIQSFERKELRTINCKSHRKLIILMSTFALNVLNTSLTHELGSYFLFMTCLHYFLLRSSFCRCRFQPQPEYKV